MSEPQGSGETALVIPAHNAKHTIGPCLDAVVPLLGRELSEIVVVDDGSTDRTAQIAARYPVQVVRGEGEGPSAARNRGWRATSAERVWFVDADCVAAIDALPQLVEVLEASDCAGVGGSYANASPDSWLASLIDDEIALRHDAMSERVDYLATFNVLYRRSALDKVGGFDETLIRAEDVDLAWRLLAADETLRFVRESRVAHFHERRLWPYLRTQAANGYWRAWLYGTHPEHAGGDSYSGWTDHLQPPLALVAAAAFCSTPWLATAGIAAAAALATAALQWPIAMRLGERRGALAALRFGAVGCARSLARGLGLALGTIAVGYDRWNRRSRSFAANR